MEEAVKTEEPSTMVSSTVESKKRFNSGPYVVGILLFLVVCLLAALTYFILKDNGIDLFSTKTENTSTIGDSSTRADSSSSSTTTNTTTCSDSDKDCKVAVTNSGWALFSLPEYNFSVEIPTYTLMQTLGGESVESYWKVWHTANISSTGNYHYDNYVHTVYANFLPSYIPANASGCGEGCFNEDTIYVDIFKNVGGKDINVVKPVFITNLTNSGVGNITGSIESKWGLNVWHFTGEYGSGSGLSGYLVVTKDYVYDISYLLSTTPADSYAVAQKVFDSMKFEDTSSSTDAN
jgi:hypothetical protein